MGAAYPRRESYDPGSGNCTLTRRMVTGMGLQDDGMSWHHVNTELHQDGTSTDKDFGIFRGDEPIRGAMFLGPAFMLGPGGWGGALAGEIG